MQQAPPEQVAEDPGVVEGEGLERERVAVLLECLELCGVLAVTSVADVGWEGEGGGMWDEGLGLGEISYIAWRSGDGPSRRGRLPSLVLGVGASTPDFGG